MKDKLKITKERTRKEFEEIKKEQEEQVEEEQTEEQENQEEFSDSEEVNFADVVNPVLESSGQSQGSIDQVVGDAPTSEKTGNNTRKEETKYDEVIAYNMPDYGSVYEQIEETRNRDREINITSMIPRHEAREEKRLNFGEWRKEMVDSNPNQEDYTIRMRRVQEDSGLPFDDKKKRRLNI